jgi:hypothetical protein
LRVLLDEMYPHRIAAELSRRGHDAEAVTARPELRALSDLNLFQRAQAERRTIVTENIPDFCRIADEHDRRGQAHHGLVLVDPRRYPRGETRTVGMIVAALDRLLNERSPAADDSRRDWL